MTAPRSTARREVSGRGNITAMLAERSHSHPHAVFLRTSDGEFTYEQMHATVGRLAEALLGIGVRAGTPVALVMRNRLEQVVVWFALARVGAVHVPINPGLTGDLMAQALQVVTPRFVIADADLFGQIAEIVEQSGPTAVVLHGIAATEPTTVGCPVHDLRDLMSASESAGDAHIGNDLDDATMLFTSGTTGPSKACVLSHRYLARQGQIHAERLGLGSDDVLYCPFPLYHIDAATLTVVAALAVGATAAIGTRFSASRFWDEVRAFDASVFNFMGATLTLLWKRDPSPLDRCHRVRLAWGVPMPDWQKQFEDRFGFPLYQVYGLTDAGVPVYDPVGGPQRQGSCGRVIDQFEIRIDTDKAHGEPRPGAVGEILVRGREAGLTMTRYHGMAEATARTIDAEGWVHTGDLGSVDADGYLTFHGRSSDSIRRRGENISAFELEQLIETHPAVSEAAAIGVPSEFTEEDVKVCVVLKAGVGLTPEELYRYCCENAARFMVPRYIEILDRLPKTPTQKVEKFRLKQLGVTAATWDGDHQQGHESTGSG